MKKKEKENKRALSQEIKELQERVEAMNQNFEQLEQQKEDQERVIDSLKQIIMLQEKLKTSEFNQFNDGIRTQVLKGIEDIMIEEQSKQMLAKMAWVSQLSDKTLSRDNLNNTQKQDLTLSVDGKLQKNQSQPSSFEDVQTNDIQNMMQSQMSIQVQNNEKQSKEVIVQTEIDMLSEFKEEIKSNYSKNTQMTKNFKVLSNDIKQNMNEILNEQLKGFLQTNINEIANLKIEIERINEKYLQEKQKVEGLQQELQKKFKYQQYYENNKSKKYRNCGIQVGQSKFKDFSACQDNSKENFSDISNLALSQNYHNDILNKNIQKTNGKNIEQDKSLKVSEKNGSQDLSSSQFSKYEYQVSSKSQNLKKNKLKTQNTRLSKSNFDEDSYNKTQSQIQIIDQKKHISEQETLKIQIKQNQQMYMMLKSLFQSHIKNSDDANSKELQKNIINFIESTANQINRANIDENDKQGKNELIKTKSAIFGAENDDISKSDLMQSWDEFSQEQIMNENDNLLSAKERHLQNSIQKSMGSGINKSLNPTEKTVKQGVQTVIGQGIQNYKAISFENSQQTSEAAYLQNENHDIVQSFQNIKNKFAYKLQGLQKEIQTQCADK